MYWMREESDATQKINLNFRKCSPKNFTDNKDHQHSYLTIQNKNLNDINSSEYEIIQCEPLHDLTNIIQNIITELPHHFQDQTIASSFHKFCDSIIGNKSQIKGSDTRLFAVKLATFVKIFIGKIKSPHK